MKRIELYGICLASVTVGSTPALFVLPVDQVLIVAAASFLLCATVIEITIAIASAKGGEG